jgi:2,3-bisphosphoglycerate-dependent phosphoglycerate mutase
MKPRMSSRRVGVNVVCGTLLAGAVVTARAAEAPTAPKVVAKAPTSTLRVYLARHGQTEWNALKKLQGGSDIPLNAVGREQAAALARTLAGVPLERIYTSALVRARQTAEAFEGRVPAVPLPGLNEQSLGAFEGTGVESEPARYAELQRRQKDPQDSLDGGETVEQHFSRVRAAVADVLSRHANGGTVLVIGHGGTNPLVLRALLDLTREQAATIKQANDEVYLVELGASGSRLLKLIPLDRLSEL